MNRFILTYGRHERQVTYRNLPKSLQQGTILVVQAREAHLYRDYTTLVLPDHIRTVAPTRQFLLDTQQEPFVMLDDDLDFAVRREDDPTKFRAANEDDMWILFADLSGLLALHPMVGVSAREGANRNTDRYIYGGRQMRVHAVNPSILRLRGVRYDRLEVMEEFDAVLQLLRQGIPNVVINDFVTNQKGSNTDGGCSHFRTAELQANNARRLAEFHAPYVSVVTKQTRSSWGGATRTDVRIQWRKALDSGRK